MRLKTAAGEADHRPGGRAEYRCHRFHAILCGRHKDAESIRYDKFGGAGSRGEGVWKAWGRADSMQVCSSICFGFQSCPPSNSSTTSIWPQKYCNRCSTSFLLHFSWHKWWVWLVAALQCTLHAERLCINYWDCESLLSDSCQMMILTDANCSIFSIRYNHQCNKITHSLSTKHLSSIGLWT